MNTIQTRELTTYIVVTMLTVSVVIGDTEHRHGVPTHRHGNGLGPHC